MEEKQLYTVTVFTENQVGLLNQISVIFTRRCLNIESLSVSASSIPGVHKFVITCVSDRRSMEKVIMQIQKRIDVLRAFLYTDDEIVYQEVINREYTVIEKTGHGEETEALFEELKRYDIRQFVRSGRVAVTKSPVEYLTLWLEEQDRRQSQMV